MSRPNRVITDLPGGLVKLFRDPSARLITIITIGLCAAILVDLLPLLRGPSSTPPEWQWTHVWPPDVVAWKLILPVSIAALIGVWAYTTHRMPQLGVPALIAIAVLAVIFRLSVQEVNQDGISIIARTLNPAYFGYFFPATKIDNLPQFLRTFDDLQPNLFGRLTTHPPGNAIFYWIIIRVVNTFPCAVELAKPILEPRLAMLPDWITTYSISDIVSGIVVSLTVPFLSALSILPLYYLARKIGSEKQARFTILFYSFIPALTVFTPVIDELFTLFASVTVWLLLGGGSKQEWYRIALAGLIAGLGTFMSFSVIPLILISELLILFCNFGHWRRLILNAIVFALASLVVWIVVWLAFDLDPLRVYATSIAESQEVIGARSYWLWLFYNPYDVLLFAGIPLAIHFLVAVWHLLRKLASRSLLTFSDILLMALVITLFTLFAVGSLRGETSRTLLYFLPLMSLVASEKVVAISRPVCYCLLMLVLMGLQTLIFQVSLGVYH